MILTLLLMLWWHFTPSRFFNWRVEARFSRSCSHALVCLKDQDRFIKNASREVCTPGIDHMIWDVLDISLMKLWFLNSWQLGHTLLEFVNKHHWLDYITVNTIIFRLGCKFPVNYKTSLCNIEIVLGICDFLSCSNMPFIAYYFSFLWEELYDATITLLNL